MPETQTKTRPATTPTPTDAQKAEEEAKKAAEAKAAKDELDFISGGAVVLTPELTKQAQPTNARNDKQKAMDTVVHNAHQQWTRAGKPSQWGKLVETKCVITYFVEPDKTAALKKLVNRAAVFHGLRPRWGSSFKASAEIIKRYNLPETYTGREVISFAIMDKRPRTGTEKSSTAAKS